MNEKMIKVILVRGPMVGQLLLADSATRKQFPNYAMRCWGQALAVSEYPELFAVLKYSYSKRYIRRHHKRNFWQWLFHLKPGYDMVPNPDFNPDFFHLPNLEPQFSANRDRDGI